MLLICQKQLYHNICPCKVLFHISNIIGSASRLYNGKSSLKKELRPLFSICNSHLLVHKCYTNDRYGHSHCQHRNVMVAFHIILNSAGHTVHVCLICDIAITVSNDGKLYAIATTVDNF